MASKGLPIKLLTSYILDRQQTVYCNDTDC